MTKMQPWYWRSLPLANRTGSEVFAALFLPKPTELGQGRAIATLLESPYPTGSQNSLSRYSLCAGAPRMLNGVRALWTPPVGEILPFLRRLLQRSTPHLPTSPPPHLPFTGGWLGWLGYDLAWEIERLPRWNPDPLPFPVAYWYEPECFAVLDHWEQTLWLAATEPAELDRLQSHLEEAKALGTRGDGRGDIACESAKGTSLASPPRGTRGALWGLGAKGTRGTDLPHLPMPNAPCPMPHAPCPMPNPQSLLEYKLFCEKISTQKVFKPLYR